MAGPQLHREKLPVTIDREAYTPAFLSLVANALSWGGSYLYMRRFGVGVNDWRVLSALGNHPGATAGEVCTVLGLNKSVVSRSVSGMVDRGLVAIERAEGQRRLYLTEEGVALHDQLLPLALERERRMLRGFTDEEIVQLRGFLRRMHDNLFEAADTGAAVAGGEDAVEQPGSHRND
ncbi:MarR family winged helix-turn-helix transcriptional regulator [Geodermatophilus ruber]|uniref:DNA-binding transcriptional regulator, MarR family n=1 Tax=Geodermatophilus ruber TaxID=504800 RepID=A0A1I4BN46_9ACTN|nr:MarR family transcriptional regulator [Geodermatophilus ruber]SFK70282.1 DNA-binding transcriptional regulator, MarR family [Geodermatophilus ruber]